jgi:hypothetical protein
MTVTFTLTAGSSATAAGPFNISGTTSGGASNTVSIATGVTKTQLSTGHTVSSISETITGGTIASTGTCTTTTPWYVVQSTPTPTPTATPVPLYNVYEICGWTDPALQYKYILYSNTYGTRGFIDVTYCASQVTSIGGIPYSEVQSTYPYAMPAGSFTTDPISCPTCS